MASSPLRFHPRAEQEYLTALSWYRELSPIAALNFESAFGQEVEKIREAPQRWPIYFSDFRKYTLRRLTWRSWHQHAPAITSSQPTFSGRLLVYGSKLIGEQV